MTPILVDHPVLAKLSELRRSQALDSLDIEGLSALVMGESAAEYPNESLPLLDTPEAETGDNPTLDEWLYVHFRHKIKRSCRSDQL